MFGVVVLETWFHFFDVALLTLKSTNIRPTHIIYCPYMGYLLCNLATNSRIITSLNSAHRQQNSRKLSDSKLIKGTRESQHLLDLLLRNTRGSPLFITTGRSWAFKKGSWLVYQLENWWLTYLRLQLLHVHWQKPQQLQRVIWAPLLKKQIL